MKKQPAGARPAGREGSEGELQRVSSGLLISPCRAGRDPLVAQAVDNVAELIPEGLSPRSPSLGGYGPISDLGVLSGGRPIAVLAPYTISKGARRGNVARPVRPADPVRQCSAVPATARADRRPGGSCLTWPLVERASVQAPRAAPLPAGLPTASDRCVGRGCRCARSRSVPAAANRS